MRILHDTDIRETDYPLIGGKAKGLHQLQRAGFRVPPFVVVAWTDLPFPSTGNDAPANGSPVPDKAGLALLKDTVSARFPAGIRFAVRSSALREDGAVHSFAGMYQTRLCVPEENLAESLQAVRLSARSERIMAYRKQHGLAHDFSISIIIQPMVDAEISGVAFGRHPVTGNAGVQVINSVYGLGEGLVSGQLTADTFEIADGQIRSVIAVKEYQLSGTDRNEIAMLPVSPDNQNIPSLTDKQLHEIGRALEKIERELAFKPDIEFAYCQQQLYLLQARPITTHPGTGNSIFPKGQTLSGPETIWDNSNIVESYPGITLPLTYSFISRVYEAVYRQLSLVMGIDASVVEAHKSVYAHMLGHIHGRVYYNLNSWHTALSLLPGYGSNSEFMDKMMGTKEKFNAPLPDDISRYHTPWRRFKSASRMLATLLSVGRQRQRFLSHFHSVHGQYKTMDFNQRTLPQLHDDYRQFENTLLKQWKAPLVNDLFCMIYFGWLQKLVAKYELDKQNASLTNDLLGASQNVSTVTPAVKMQAFAREIEGEKPLRQLFAQHEPPEIWRQLPVLSPSLYSRIQEHLDEWGHRCMAELKLETVSYAMQPTLWIGRLQALLQSPAMPDASVQASRLKLAAEQTVANALENKPLQKAVFGHVLKKARYFVSNRENLRYERTKAFAVVRQLFLAMGQKLTVQHALHEPRDIFYLTQEEIFDFITTARQADASTGHGPCNLNSIVSKRKPQYAGHENTHVPERFASTGTTMPVFGLQDETAAIAMETHLKGIAASAGTVRGTVHVVRHPHEVAVLQGHILVTVSTDPGWVVLFPGCGGILVERGSLLSHAAIVSREMGIPCIVGIKDLTRQLQTGDEVVMNGATGDITVTARFNPAA